MHSDSDEGIQRLNQEAAKVIASARRAGIEIAPEHAIRWLTRNAVQIWTACMVAQVRQDIVDYDEYSGPLDLRARDFVQEKEDEFVHVLRMVSKPDEWIKETPLYRRLMEGLTVSPVEYFGAA